ncbi:hypothetical protein BDZ94DRAFT_1214090 [Collybia nuda]|uniref:Mucoidy inhibitor A n=1 Tax=Collybia nuda TaxID=64659 RepID=A0A9P5YAI7_9AGAR|nr:hypothetical protein BDZ94DRAFT_1214090 [Collybia nuda]
MNQSTENALTGNELPPPILDIHAIELVSTEDSKITGVSVYAGRAEVTRVFQFNVQGGQNQVTIDGLPNVLDQDSFRVEGRGSATIHDVTISHTPKPGTSSPSPTLKALQIKKKRNLMAIERCKKSIKAIEEYLNTLSVQHIDMAKLGQVVADYNTTTEQLDEQLMELEQKLSDVEGEIAAENTKLSGTNVNDKLGLRAAIGIFADSESEVEIALIYAVHGASWDALYDIRVDMQTKEKAVKLIYKAAITQSTGEDWTDISLTLETATPTFGLGLPTLHPWTLSFYKHSPTWYGAPPSGAMMSAPMAPMSAAIAPPPLPPAMRTRGGVGGGGGIKHRELAVSSKGNINATFEVPGLLTIPSDGVAHNVTIAQLHLDAVMSWVCVPKKDARMHLNAKIKNASEYTLLQGNASVYVNGSFIAKTPLPSVSAEENFDCSLGLDPSIRVTYHPRVINSSKSGFYSKLDTQVMSQTITLFNTKSSAVQNVKVIEQIPVSQDSSITVKLDNPALPASSEVEKPTQVQVSQEVVAQWHGADEPGVDTASLGRNGKLNWVCSVPAQKKINLVLQWEVSAPVGGNIVGLRDA